MAAVLMIVDRLFFGRYKIDYTHGRLGLGRIVRLLTPSSAQTLSGSPGVHQSGAAMISVPMCVCSCSFVLPFLHPESHSDLDGSGGRSHAPIEFF